MLRRHLWIAHLATACWLIPASAGAVSLVVDRLGTPDVVQAGDMVSFSFAFQFEPDEVLLSTQAEISAPHLSDFQFSSTSGINGSNPWDLSSTFRRTGPDADGNLFNPMWVHAENVFDDDPKGVTWDEVGGLAPLGHFTAIANYNGEIVFDLSRWSLDLLDGFSTEPGRFGTLGHGIPLDPAWAHYRTGVTIVGGLDLPPPPVAPPVVQPPPVTPPPPPRLEQPPSSIDPPPRRSMDGFGVLGVMPTAISAVRGCGVNSAGEQVCTLQHSSLLSRLFYGVISGIDAGAPDLFYPSGDDASDLQFNVPGLHIGGVEGAAPEPSTSVLVLLGSGFLVLIRHRWMRSGGR